MQKSLLIYTCFTVSLLLFEVQETFAQPEMNLSLNSARHYALEHNRSLKNAGLAIDEAGLRLRETIAQGLPQVEASVDYNNFFGSTATLGAMPGFEIEFNPTSNLQISLGQLIFSGSYIVGIQTARLFEEISEVSMEKTGLEVKAQVTMAYYLGLVSEKSKSIIESNLGNIRDVLRNTRAMVDAGVAEEVDYDQVSVQVNMLENALKAAGRQVEISHNILRLQMGLDPSVEVILTDELDHIVEQADFTGSLIHPFSLKENFDFQLTELQTSVARKQVDLERAAYLPAIMGFYNFTEKLLRPEFDITPNHVIGFNVSIPIFSSGIRQSRVNQARINLKVAENQKEMVSEQLIMQEKQLRYNLNNAIEQFESQKANVEVARRVYENIKQKYEQGLVSSLDLTTSNSNYLQAENSYISAMLQLLEAQVEMDKLLSSM